jgi:hypothetical protein
MIVQQKRLDRARTGRPSPTGTATLSMHLVRHAALLLGALVVATGAQPAAHAAACPGSCAAELATNPKSTPKYLKNASAALSKCLKSGTPACPTPCPLPDPVAFGLSEGCGTLLRCQLGELAKASAGGAWETSGRCVATRGKKCELHRYKQARTLATRSLSAALKGVSGKLGRLALSCASGVRQRAACADSEAACTAAMGVAHGLMESLHAACDDVPLSEAEMATAVDAAIRHLAKRGMGITPDSWQDATALFALVAQTFSETDCLRRARPAVRSSGRTEALADGETVYCGPNSCTKGANGCALPDPGACVNAVCAVHDSCYAGIERSECIRRDCTWSSQTLGCDAAFFVEASACWGAGQCGFTCKAVIAAATALTAMNFQLEHDGSSCPRRVGECPTCPGQCQSDCTCSAVTTTTTTTTLPPGCEFSCGDGICIAAAIVCNGSADCPGGQDEDPAICSVQGNCCTATRGCPGETGSSCAATCCCCPDQQACCADWTVGCCPAS